MLSEELQQKLEGLPTQPGVYVMKDRLGEVVYVGKAVSLRSRVAQYFQERSSDTRAFIPFLEELLGDIEVMITPSEKDALLLENELIKKHRPRFNIRLRDDKNFISLRLSRTHPYPRLEVVRRVRKDGARYFGPYSSASSIRETLGIVNRHFQLRTCTDQVMANRRRPCLQYQIKRCPAPCVYSVPQEDYQRSVEEVALFLEGKADELTAQLGARMKDAAGKLEYERAAQLQLQQAGVPHRGAARKLPRPVLRVGGVHPQGAAPAGGAARARVPGSLADRAQGRTRARPRARAGREDAPGRDGLGERTAQLRRAAAHAEE